MLPAFQELGIAENLLVALERKGFEKPSAVQSAAIPLLLAGERDVIAQAQTGTGKTAAFGLPILQVLGEPEGHVRAIVLAPTRELSIQVANEIESLQGEGRLQIVPIYGGQSIEVQISRMRRGADVVVGTPGRVMDMMRRGILNLDDIDFAVLDEADEMLNMGFVEDIETILSETNPDKRMLMFSATMPEPILRIAENFMREYEIVRCTPETLTTDLTEQLYFEVKRNDKLDALCRIMDIEDDFFAMVFCRTRDDVDDVVEQLHLRGYDVEGLHGDIAQAQRTRVIDRFKRKFFDVLICTDVAARGIDVNNLTHVINYSIPQNAETYIHRIGRTGRAGQSGTAITFVTPAETFKLKQIQREAKVRINRGSLPEASSIVVRKIAKLEQEITALINDNKHECHTEVANKILETVTPECAVAALLTMHCGNELQLETYADFGTKRREEFARNHVRLYVGLGKIDGMGAKKLLDYLFEHTRIGCQKLGKVSCYDRFSFVEASSGDADIIVRAMRSETRNGRPLVEIAKDRNAEGGEESAEDRGGERRERSYDRGGERRERSFDRGGERRERSYDRGGERRERSFDRGGERRDRGFGGERRERSFDRGGERRDRGFGGERRERSFDRGCERRDRGFGGERRERSYDRGGERRGGYDRGYTPPADGKIVMSADGTRPLNRRERRAIMFAEAKKDQP